NPGCGRTLRTAHPPERVTAPCRATPRQPAPPRPLCRHLGRELRRETCSSCAGHVELKVLHCEWHDAECTVGKPLAGVPHCCAHCPQHESRADISPEITWRVPTAPPAPIERLAVITSFFNPQHYRRPLLNYHRFAAGIAAAGLPLWTIELAFDDDSFQLPETETSVFVRGRRDRHLMFQKERLLNLLIGRLPAEIDAVAWIDADVQFLNPHWVDQAETLLTNHQVCQLWETCYDLLPDGNLAAHPPSSAKLWATHPEKHNDFRHSHPGYAWAGRAAWLRRHGLCDWMITGAGDLKTVEGLTGERGLGEDMLAKSFSAGWERASRDWSRAVYADVAGSFACVPGTIVHHYHGSVAGRRYGDRWRLLVNHQFDPFTDIEHDEAGLWRWTDAALRDKPELVQAVADCFASRREDD
ncbi:MAG: hypothetical protein KGL39_37820, partial [Patescibacteria group bacterium]|nr:hypothetical protein [Patescibacteria group bacterium]